MLKKTSAIQDLEVQDEYSFGKFPYFVCHYLDQTLLITFAGLCVEEQSLFFLFANIEQSPTAANII